MTFRFDGPIVYWRGPAPFYFVRIDGESAADIKAVSNRVTYGWGCITCQATVNGHTFTTALMPKDGAYLLPLRVAVRKAINADEGDTVTGELVMSG